MGLRGCSTLVATCSNYCEIKYYVLGWPMCTCQHACSPRPLLRRCCPAGAGGSHAACWHLLDGHQRERHIPGARWGPGGLPRCGACTKPPAAGRAHVRRGDRQGDTAGDAAGALCEHARTHALRASSPLACVGQHLPKRGHPGRRCRKAPPALLLLLLLLPRMQQVSAHHLFPSPRMRARH